MIMIEFDITSLQRVTWSIN